ncbi:MAG TPA: 50S ribosomal protein L14 [Planctomycetes bacterium]|nr:50S ribosomal protein L14 [Planctomycetota bacterium]
MIHRQTLLEVADNTGARRAMMITVLGAGRRSYAKLGDVVVCSVKKANPGAEIKPGDVVTGVIVRARYPEKREDGSRIRFDTNAIVLIDKEKNPRGTRVFGPVAKELRTKGFMRIVSLAAEVV